MNDARSHSPADDLRRLESLLVRAREGDRNAFRQVWVLLLEDLHAMARRLMASERSDHTLQPTALVGEIYTRLCGEEIPMVLDRDHFIKLARRVMMHVLIEHGRRVALRDSILRPDGAAVRLSPALLGGFGRANSARPEAPVDPDVLLSGLEELERRHGERAEAYRMQVVLGMKVQEIAIALEKPYPTIQSWLRFCRSFMDVYLGRDPKGGDLHP